MYTARAFTIACATTLPVLVVFAAIRLPSGTALGVAVAGAVVLANLAASEQAHTRFVRAAAAGTPEASQGAAMGLVARHAVVLPLAIVLAATLGALPTALGFATLALGAVVLATGQALRTADARATARGQSRLLETTA